MAVLTEELLRKVVEEAHEKGQRCLLIWYSWKIWDEVAYQFCEGNEYHDFALAQAAQGKDAAIALSWCGFRLPGTLIIPVEKMHKSKEYFEYISNVCISNHYEGPITLLPANKIAECID